MYSCCMSVEEKESRRIHNEIEKQLKIDKRNLRRQVKLLLLGDGESGKSTVLKQMRIIHGKGYSEEDKRVFTKHVFQNVFGAVFSLIYAMKDMQIPFRDDKNTEYAEMIIKSVNKYTVDTMEAHYSVAIKSLWSDQGMQECYERRREFRLSDSAKYFLDDVNRISSASYLPTVQDILRVRVKTLEWEHYFDLGSVILRMLQLGSRRQEWRWIQPFEDVTAIIFLGALSNYDKFEYPDETYLQNSVNLFKAVINHRCLRTAAIILFLNKTDLFQEKIFKSHLADYFPEYRGPKCDPEAAKKFILEMYEKMNSEGRLMYAHYTCAIDAENIRKTFESVRDTVTSFHFWNVKLL